MKESIKCECLVDCGASRVRGWHNSAPCSRPAKWLVRFQDGREEKVCGIHKRSEQIRYEYSIESITPLTKSK